MMPCLTFIRYINTCILPLLFTHFTYMFIAFGWLAPYWALCCQWLVGMNVSDVSDDWWAALNQIPKGFSMQLVARKIQKRQSEVRLSTSLPSTLSTPSNCARYCHFLMATFQTEVRLSYFCCLVTSFFLPPLFFSFFFLLSFLPSDISSSHISFFNRS